MNEHIDTNTDRDSWVKKSAMFAVFSPQLFVQYSFRAIFLFVRLRCIPLHCIALLRFALFTEFPPFHFENSEKYAHLNTK